MDAEKTALSSWQLSTPSRIIWWFFEFSQRKEKKRNKTPRVLECKCCQSDYCRLAISLGKIKRVPSMGRLSVFDRDQFRWLSVSASNSRFFLFISGERRSQKINWNQSFHGWLKSSRLSWFNDTHDKRRFGVEFRTIEKVKLEFFRLVKVLIPSRNCWTKLLSFFFANLSPRQANKNRESAGSSA